jgi:hypothetical protein
MQVTRSGDFFNDKYPLSIHKIIRQVELLPLGGHKS